MNARVGQSVACAVHPAADPRMNWQSGGLTAPAL